MGVVRQIDVGVQYLVSLMSVTKLGLSCCDEIIDKILSYLVGLVGLKALDLCGCYRLTDVGIRNLGLLTSPTHPRLDGWARCCYQTLKVTISVGNFYNLSLSYQERKSGFSKIDIIEVCRVHRSHREIKKFWEGELMLLMRLDCKCVPCNNALVCCF